MHAPLPQKPRWLISRFLDWINQPIYTKNKIEIRRIDIVLALGFLGCVAYYAQYGWQSALGGGLLYILMVMMAIWLL